MNITIHINYIDIIGDRSPIAVVSSILEESSIGGLFNKKQHNNSSRALKKEMVIQE
jgi:hypothetical protein